MRSLFAPNWNRTPLPPFICRDAWGSCGKQGIRVPARRAQECLEIARAFGDRDARVTLSHIAQAWLRLADMAARGQPIAQQQQQIQPKADDKE